MVRVNLALLSGHENIIFIENNARLKITVILIGFYTNRQI